MFIKRLQRKILSVNTDSPLSNHFRISEIQKKALLRLGIKTVRDILYYFPVRYGNTAELRTIGTLNEGEEVIIFGKISGLKTKKAFRRKIPMAEALLTDETGSIKILWLHQAYLAKMFSEGALVRVSGKVSRKNDSFSLLNPKIESVSKIPIAIGSSLFGDTDDTGTLYPVYKETRGISSQWIYHTIQKIFTAGILTTIEDPLPDNILSKYNLPGIKTALVWIHAPHKESDALAARKRFSFEEVFFIQIERQKKKREWKSHQAYIVETTLKDLKPFTDRFPFPLTNAQERSISDVLNDFKRGEPMSRLVEGDVGSGKTAVAAAGAYAIVTTRPKGQNFGNLQVAYMAPTEILATQHFESFIEYFKNSGISVGLITGSGCKKFPSKINPGGWTDISRKQLLTWVSNGEIPILVGTHALIQKTVHFKHLAYVVIDEQHRFGTAQRQKLREKESLIPHLLSMTATPIPRTLALTLYGDLDLSLVDELPQGRKPIETEIVLPDKRKSVYEKVRQELHLGRQAYVICPRIEEPDPNKEKAILAKSVREEAKRLKKEVFADFQIDILHSKMTPKQKEETMVRFKNKEIDILVATSVVEVGVNVPNATVIIIEGGERFGLAQLHQLRGRVMRSAHQPYCFIFAESKSKTSVERLKAIKKAKNGFELAEFDLAQRGAGDLLGKKQWGITDLGMEAMKNLKMVQAAREEALSIIEKDPSLLKHRSIQAELSTRNITTHFE